MNPIVRSLTGAFVNAACLFAIDRLLWPDGRSIESSIGRAVFGGLLAETLSYRRVRKKRDGKDPYPPRFYFISGVAVLAVCGAFWFRVAPRLPEFRLFVLFGGIAFSLYLFWYATTLLQRIDTERTSTGA